MITFYVSITSILFLVRAGGLARRWVDNKGDEGAAPAACVCLAIGAFGIYALIVGK